MYGVSVTPVASPRKTLGGELAVRCPAWPVLFICTTGLGLSTRPADGAGQENGRGRQRYVDGDLFLKIHPMGVMNGPFAGLRGGPSYVPGEGTRFAVGADVGVALMVAGPVFVSTSFTARQYVGVEDPRVSAAATWLLAVGLTPRW